MASTETRKFAYEQAHRRLGRLAFQINQTVRSRDAEAVHDLRVAIRRFVQVLRVFKRWFGGKEVRKIRRGLKKMMDLAGAVRNWDVALKLTSKHQRDEPAGVRHALENHRRESARVLVACLKQWADRQSSLKWRGALANAATTNTDAASKAPVARTAQRMLPAMAQAFLERGNEAVKTKISPRDLHHFRIASKRFRYTLELFAPVYGSPLESSLERIRRTQELLGDINDCDTVRDLLSQFKGAEKVVSRLKKRQRRRIEEFQRYWTETLAGDEEMRRWRALLSRPGGAMGQARKPVGRASVASHAAGRRPAAIA